MLFGDQEATNKEFIIRLFDKKNSGNNEEVIPFGSDTKLERWINNNLLIN